MKRARFLLVIGALSTPALFAAACADAPSPIASSLNADGSTDADRGVAPADGGDEGASPYAELEPGEADSVGKATTRVFDDRAFEQPAVTMTAAERSTWIAGQATFQLAWTAARGTDRSGLGPTFNAASCEACHAKNGRGAPPLVPNGALVTALLRVSRPGANEQGGPLGDPIYGDQLQGLAIAGVPAEATVRLVDTLIAGTYADGTPYTLTRPAPVIEAGLGALAGDTLLSLRVAQQSLGVGFLEAIPETDLLANEDPDDADGDGISGRANRVWDVRAGAPAIGRFGWKANQPTAEQQSAAAFAGDVGITSALFPDANCPASQTACAAAASAGADAGSGPNEVELSATRLAAVTAFVRGTSVPGRRDAGAPDVLGGKALFHAMGCASCHVPSFATSAKAAAAFLSGERVWPYTDLLLHDMGDGLADGRPDFAASGAEWRTPPLWGLGLIETVSGHERLLHDGRARGIAEAVLWHGGEAASSAERFREASSEERRLLVTFLRSL